MCESASETDNVQALNVSSTRMLADYAVSLRIKSANHNFSSSD